MNEYPFHEPFGPEYATPDPTRCPDCACCTRRLCMRGRATAWRCIGSTSATDDAERAAIAACPCSAETTPGTEAHRAAQVRAEQRAEQAGDEG